jgi:hypothetical protein
LAVSDFVAIAFFSQVRLSKSAGFSFVKFLSSLVQASCSGSVSLAKYLLGQIGFSASVLASPGFGFLPIPSWFRWQSGLVEIHVACKIKSVKGCGLVFGRRVLHKSGTPNTACT